MKNEIHFDVLVVYSEKIASSSVSIKATSPFSARKSTAIYDEAYAYFLRACQKNGLSAALCTSADIIGPSLCRGYWEYKNKRWLKRRQPCRANLVFDKFSPVSPLRERQRDKLFALSSCRPFNHPRLFKLFFDKQNTYQRLRRLAVPTVFLTHNSPLGMQKALKTLKLMVNRHPHKNDFADEIVVKDRFGAGGLQIKKFAPNQVEAFLKFVRGRRKYIIQPLVKFDEGLVKNGHLGRIDIRLIFLKNKLVQTYFRIAKKNEFRCNEHCGGELIYIDEVQVPAKVIQQAKNIIQKIKPADSLFSLDFIVSNDGNVYLLEGNTGPGLDWNPAKKENEIASKQLMDVIVEELKRRHEVIQKRKKRRFFNLSFPPFVYPLPAYRYT